MSDKIQPKSSRTYSYTIQAYAAALDIEPREVDTSDGSYELMCQVLYQFEHEGSAALSKLLGIASDSDDGDIAQEIDRLRSEVRRLRCVVSGIQVVLNGHGDRTQAALYPGDEVFIIHESGDEQQAAVKSIGNVGGRLVIVPMGKDGRYAE